MDVLNVVLGGLGGAILTCAFAYWLQRRRRLQEEPKGRAYEVLKELGKRLKQPEGEYFFPKSVDDNYEVARDLYRLADGEVIATCFNENPADYGDGDLVRGFPYGSMLTRITSEEVCSGRSKEKAAANLGRASEGATLVIIPRGERYTRMDGIFCRFRDHTHLAFTAFRHATDPSRNRGAVFRDGIAESFFEYYRDLADQYVGTE